MRSNGRALNPEVGSSKKLIYLRQTEMGKGAREGRSARDIVGQGAQSDLGRGAPAKEKGRAVGSTKMPPHCSARQRQEACQTWAERFLQYLHAPDSLSSSSSSRLRISSVA